MLPEIRRQTGDVPVAVVGWSMGGYGALLAAAEHASDVSAACAASPALWPSFRQAAPRAFDDAADFARHDLFRSALARRLYRIPVWIDMGGEDPFRASGTDFARLLRSRGVRVTFHVWPGGHEYAYWQRHLPAYLRFYAAALRSCR